MLSNNAAVCIATLALSQRVHVHVIRDTPKLGVEAPSEHTALTSLELLLCPRQRKSRVPGLCVPEGAAQGGALVARRPVCAALVLSAPGIAGSLSAFSAGLDPQRRHSRH